MMTSKAGAAALWWLAILSTRTSEYWVSAQCLNDTYAFQAPGAPLYDLFIDVAASIDNVCDANKVCTLDFTTADTTALDAQCTNVGGLLLKHDVTVTCTNITSNEVTVDKYLGSPICFSSTSCTGSLEEAQEAYEINAIKSSPALECAVAVAVSTGDSGEESGGEATVDGGSGEGTVNGEENGGGGGTGNSSGGGGGGTTANNNGESAAAAVVGSMAAFLLAVVTSIWMGQ